MSKIKTVLLTLLLFSVVSACGAPISPVADATPTARRIPLTEAEVPRVELEDAKAALDRGEAIMVDVRSADAYGTSHIIGAIHIPLGEIESNPTALTLAKDEWIITYCT